MIVGTVLVGSYLPRWISAFEKTVAHSKFRIPLSDGVCVNIAATEIKYCVSAMAIFFLMKS